MRKLVAALVFAFLALCAVLAVRAARIVQAPPPVTRVSLAVNADSAAQRLAGALRFQTITREDGVTDSAAFRGLHEYLAKQFPAAHKALQRETVNSLSLLYTWRGKDTTLAPIVLMGHLDVVPVIPGTETKWMHPAFEGAIADGFIWGRGSMDDKVTVLGVLEAVERLAEQGFQPVRTVYLAFGHDEEGGGPKGAPAIVQTLKARGVKLPALVLDEGGAVMDGAQLGVAEQVALVGIAEKGYVTLALTAEGPGGHSSAPPAHTQIGRVSRAVAALEADPFPLKLEGGTRDMLEAVAPAMGFEKRLALANLWLFGSAVTRSLGSVPATASLLRTTTAPTIFNAGAKDNVLPPVATAKVNFRIFTGESVASVIERVTRVINDTAVHVTVSGANRVEPSALSDVNGPAFALVARSIRETLGTSEPIVAPYLVPGATDSRNWAQAGARAVFRFSPIPYEKDGTERFHGTNERVSVAGYAQGIAFFVQLLRGLQGL